MGKHENRLETRKETTFLDGEVDEWLRSTTHVQIRTSDKPRGLRGLGL
jgi:hypothetical protein